MTFTDWLMVAGCGFAVLAALAWFMPLLGAVVLVAGLAVVVASARRVAAALLARAPTSRKPSAGKATSPLAIFLSVN